jgi:hypothetical protein
MHPRRCVLITPHDTNDLANAVYAISFAGAGALRVLTLDGDDVTIPNGALAAGVQHALAVRRVFSTGTGATGIVGYY